jgi:hypothetical protein
LNHDSLINDSGYYTPFTPEPENPLGL